MEITLPPTEIDEPVTAVEFLAGRTGLSKARIKDAMTKGAVWLESDSSRQRLRRATRELRKGDRLSLYYDEQILATQPPSPELVEDAGSYSVWIKPAGLMSGGTRFGDHCAIDRVVERLLDRPTFLVHRLDRWVWGLMLLAHGRQPAAHLASQFKDRTTIKTYRAVVHGRLDTSLKVETPVEGRQAVSSIRPIQAGDTLSLVEVRIETGRKHQIRVHLSGAGHPVVGDRQYGSGHPGDLQLAAVELGFAHPETGQQMLYRLPDNQHPVI